MKKIISLILISAFTFTSFFIEPNVVYGATPTDYISCWDLDETSGTRIDANTTNSNDLTDNNTVLYATGKASNGADFERTNNEYLSITDATQVGLDMTSAVSISFWMKLESAAPVDNNMGIFSKTARTSGGYMLGYRNYPSGNDNFYFEAWNGGSITYAVSNDLNLSTGTWYHVVVTYSAGTFVLYINNAAQTFTKTGSGTTITGNSDPFYLGRLQSDLNSYFDGVIDIFEIYDRALTSDEVTALYNSSNGVACPVTARSTGSGTTPGANDVIWMSWYMNHDRQRFLS